MQMLFSSDSSLHPTIPSLDLNPSAPYLPLSFVELEVNSSFTSYEKQELHNDTSFTT